MRLIDHLIRHIYENLQKLNIATQNRVKHWATYSQYPANKRLSTAREKLRASWSLSYFDVQQILVALLAYESIEVDGTLDHDGRQSFHLNVLGEFSKGRCPFRRLFMERMICSKAAARRAFGDEMHTYHRTVHFLLDTMRRFRTWFMHGQKEGIAQPVINGVTIDVPTEESLLHLWHYHVMRTLADALKICFLKEESELIQSPCPCI